MGMDKKTSMILAGFGILMLMAPAALALTPPLPPGLTDVNSVPTPLTNLQTDVPNLANAIILWMFWILLVFAIIMALVAAYRYLTSSGDPEKVTQANKTLMYAAIAAAVAVIAFGLPRLIWSFFVPGGIFFRVR